METVTLQARIDNPAFAVPGAMDALRRSARPCSAAASPLGRRS